MNKDNTNNKFSTNSRSRNNPETQNSPLPDTYFVYINAEATDQMSSHSTLREFFEQILKSIMDAFTGMATAFSNIGTVNNIPQISQTSNQSTQQRQSSSNPHYTQNLNMDTKNANLERNIEIFLAKTSQALEHFKTEAPKMRESLKQRLTLQLHTHKRNEFSNFIFEEEINDTLIEVRNFANMGNTAINSNLYLITSTLRNLEITMMVGNYPPFQIEALNKNKAAVAICTQEAEVAINEINKICKNFEQEAKTVITNICATSSVEQGTSMQQ